MIVDESAFLVGIALFNLFGCVSRSILEGMLDQIHDLCRLILGEVPRLLYKVRDILEDCFKEVEASNFGILPKYLTYLHIW
jgi:hypothetical protein